MRWDPTQYERFKQERRAPFDVLRGLVRPRHGMRVVDLGCGTGEWTASLHDALGAASTLGIDTDARMLERAQEFATDTLTFETSDIHDFDPAGRFDLIFANASLQWVPEPRKVLGRLVAGLPQGGQLAIQVPVQDDYPSHALAKTVASSAPFHDALGGWVRKTHALDLRAYASLLHELGMQQIHARVQVFAHELPDRDAIVEWVRGSLLRAYQARLSPEMFQAYVEAYRAELAQALPDASPFYYPFTRLLVHAVRP